MTPTSPGATQLHVQAGSHGRSKHKGSPFISWLKKGSTEDAAVDAKKLASPAEEIKLVFLRQLELGSFNVDGKKYHSVFTGAQIVDIILGHFGLPDRTLACNVASRLIDCSLYKHVSGPSLGKGDGTVVDSNTEIYTLTAEAHKAMRSLQKQDASLPRLSNAKKHSAAKSSADSSSAHRTPSSRSSQGGTGSRSHGRTQGGFLRGEVRAKGITPPLRSPLPPLITTCADHDSREQERRKDNTAHRGSSTEVEGCGVGHHAAIDSPSDTLATQASSMRNSSSSSSSTNQPITPTTARESMASSTLLMLPTMEEDQEGEQGQESGGSGASLQQVNIPTSDLDGLLNTWSYLSERFSPQYGSDVLLHQQAPSSAPDSPRPAPQEKPALDRSTASPKGGSHRKTASSAAALMRSGHLRAPEPAGRSVVGLDSDQDATDAANDIDSDNNRGAHDDLDTESPSWARQSPLNARRRWAMYNGRFDDAEHGHFARRLSHTARRYPSAPSLFEQCSDTGSDATFRESRDAKSHIIARPSLPLSCEEYMCDSMFTQGNSPRFSDITIASGYSGPQFAHSPDRSVPSLGSMARSTSEYGSALMINVESNGSSICSSRPSGGGSQARSSAGSQYTPPVLPHYHDAKGTPSGFGTASGRAATEGEAVYSPPHEEISGVAIAPILSLNGSEASNQTSPTVPEGDSFMAGSTSIFGSVAASIEGRVKLGDSVTALSIPHNTLAHQVFRPSADGDAELSLVAMLPASSSEASPAAAARVSADSFVRNTAASSSTHRVAGPPVESLGNVRLAREHAAPDLAPADPPALSAFKPHQSSRALSASLTIDVGRAASPPSTTPSPLPVRNSMGFGSVAGAATIPTALSMFGIREPSIDQARTAPDDDGGSAFGSIGRQLHLWRDTIPPELLQMLSPTAIDQQEAIHEIITTEQRYLHDLELIDAVFVQPLLAAPAVMPQSRAEEFLKTLFFNYQDLIKSSQALCAKLAQRQAESQVVERVGDIFLEWAEHDLCEFIEYSVHVPLAQAELEAELLKSKAMADFLKDAEAHPDARKLPIQSFIGRPATRFARYPLLLNAIIKRAPEGGDDVLLLNRAVEKVRRALDEVDRRTGEGAEALRIRQISQRLRLVKGARESLALSSPSRRLIKEGVFHMPENGGQVLVFLFDNSLIMATEERVAYAKNVPTYVADERIIPISMLDVSIPAAETSALMGIREVLGLQSGPRQGLLRHSSSSSSVKGRGAAASAGGGSARMPLSFIHIGCRSLCRTLLAGSSAERDQWVDTVHARICTPQTLVEAYTDFRLLSDRDFAHSRVPLCSAPFVSSSGCQMILFGNKDGMHMGIYGVPTSVVRVSHIGSISKIHILRKYNMVVALSDANLLVFALSSIEKSAAQANAVVPCTKIASSVGFFDVGVYLGSPLIVLMKPRGSKSHFKCIQPYFNAPSPSNADESAGSPDPSEGGSNASAEDCKTGGAVNSARLSSTPSNGDISQRTESQDGIRTIRVVYQSSRANLRLIGEFAISGKTKRVHFLRRKLCIVCSSGFEIVDVQTSHILRSLPDPMDDDFSFIDQNESGQALATCKVGREFLLCFEAFAFFIDNFGRRSRPHVFIRWEMRPHMVTFRYPYVVAINAKFLEVRHMETGVLLSIVRIQKAACLNPDSRSPVLHIAVGPSIATTPAPAANASASASGEDRSPTSSTTPSSRLSSISSASIAPTPANGGHASVVPGLAGPSGTKSFPEGNPAYYRVIEVRLPPLRTTAKSVAA